MDQCLAKKNKLWTSDSGVDSLVWESKLLSITLFCIPFILINTINSDGARYKAD